MKEHGKFFQIDQFEQKGVQSGNYREFLRVPALSAGVYALPAGGTDPQKPHAEDEMYYVLRGRSRMRVGTEDRAISPGTVIFVPAHAEHRFFDIEEDLTLLVFFAPAET